MYMQIYCSPGQRERRCNLKGEQTRRHAACKERDSFLLHTYVVMEKYLKPAPKMTTKTSGWQHVFFFFLFLFRFLLIHFLGDKDYKGRSGTSKAEKGWFRAYSPHNHCLPGDSGDLFGGGDNIVICVKIFDWSGSSFLNSIRISDRRSNKPYQKHFALLVGVKEFMLLGTFGEFCLFYFSREEFFASISSIIIDCNLEEFATQELKRTWTTLGREERMFDWHIQFGFPSPFSYRISPAQGRYVITHLQINIFDPATQPPERLAIFPLLLLFPPLPSFPFSFSSLHPSPSLNDCPSSYTFNSSACMIQR